jgi:hypothetical protein
MGRLGMVMVMALAVGGCVFDASGLPGGIDRPAPVERGGDAPGELLAPERGAEARLVDRTELDHLPLDKLQPDYGPPPACDPKADTCPFWAPFCCDHGDGTAACATVTNGCVCGKPDTTTCIWPYDRCCDSGNGKRCHGWWEFLTCP